MRKVVGQVVLITWVIGASALLIANSSTPGKSGTVGGTEWTKRSH